MFLARVFTVSEANALAPLLEDHLTRIARLTDEARALSEALEVPAPSADGAAVAEAGQAHDALRRTEQQIRDEVLALARLGAQVTSLQPPTVDLPARLRGNAVQLSFALGDDGVTHWHGADADERWAIEDATSFGVTLPQ